MLSKNLEDHMKTFINKFNGGTKSNSTKRIGNITEDEVRYFLYITVLLLNAAVTIKHKDLMELEWSKIVNGDCEPVFLNLIALSPLSPVSLPKTCQNYMVIKIAMKQVLSTNVIEFIYPIIIFFAGLITSGTYIRLNAGIINTIVSTIFNRVKTDEKKDEEKQNKMEKDVIKILNEMRENRPSIKLKEKSTAEALLSLRPHPIMTNNNTSGSKTKKNKGGKSKKNKGGKSKKNKGGKSKKNKTKKN